ncbi:hypothetical protein [Actinomadura fibrosa]|uniref:Uncharacterized protein n=1 Tax=Actinomadura fibrosa TaxID=111802 RepID=A0ABW2XG44_9ACTN|nr:hypothetical protein [Actinomadura fibrosa]
MALHIGRKRHETIDDAPGATAERRTGRGHRLWPARKAGTTDTAARTAPAGTEPTRTVVVRPKRRRWLRSTHNPISAMILAAGWAAAAILVLGMLLTWGEANPGNTIVDATLDAGRWLATPFHDIFTRSDPKEQLYINWSIAAVVYYVLARAFSWMTRF